MYLVPIVSALEADKSTDTLNKIDLKLHGYHYGLLLT